MPFVHRDASGAVLAIYQDAQPGVEEELPVNHPDIMAFLNARGGDAAPLIDLVESDTAMARVIEDLIELLVLKGVITMDDLPDAAQIKLNKRQKWRGSLEEALEAFGGGKVI